MQSLAGADLHALPPWFLAGTLPDAMDGNRDKRDGRGLSRRVESQLRKRFNPSGPQPPCMVVSESCPLRMSMQAQEEHTNVAYRNFGVFVVVHVNYILFNALGACGDSQTNCKMKRFLYQASAAHVKLRNSGGGQELIGTFQRRREQSRSPRWVIPSPCRFEAVF